ncbi:hypothetical protein DPMN_095796 [Dreissena polymorpha]|uniref:Uncharacterized protein n=1 Tax=Dreissena polymorpha TaxID=45954 RepID=A0A9D4R382_DREPO|nr:hypothetical protein DPMN_095796 [Dreissena polymorpha]
MIRQANKFSLDVNNSVYKKFDTEREESAERIKGDDISKQKGLNDPKTNVLTKFHEEVLTRIKTIFELIQDIITTNVLTTKFHEDWTINVTFRVKNAPSPCGHVFHPAGTIFKLVHWDKTINVASRVLTRKNVPTLGGHFHADRTISVAPRVLTRQMLTPHEAQCTKDKRR